MRKGIFLGLGLGLAGLSAPLTASALDLVINGETYTVSGSDVSFTDGGALSISNDSIPVGNGTGGGDGGGGGGDGGGDGDGDGDGDGGDGGGGDVGELPDGATVVGEFDWYNPPGSKQSFTITTETHVIPFKTNGKRAYGALANAYSTLNPAHRRMWISRSPAGEPVDGGVKCDRSGYEAFTIRWIHGASFSGYCDVGAEYAVLPERGEGKALRGNQSVLSEPQGRGVLEPTRFARV
ncbi:MAG: hypothetical protein U5L11_00365 [Arhodomonas sp.]|nr:hypothetical protein [Arhodomonas sp.]